MSKKKRFQHRAIRPSLAASLEAARQGQSLKVNTTNEISTERPLARQSASELTFVGSEIRQIVLLMGSLLVVLIGLTIFQSRTGFLTKFVARLIGQ